MPLSPPFPSPLLRLRLMLWRASYAGILDLPVVSVPCANELNDLVARTFLATDTVVKF